MQGGAEPTIRTEWPGKESNESLVLLLLVVGRKPGEVQASKQSGLGRKACSHCSRTFIHTGCGSRAAVNNLR